MSSHASLTDLCQILIRFFFIPQTQLPSFKDTYSTPTDSIYQIGIPILPWKQYQKKYFFQYKIPIKEHRRVVELQYQQYSLY